MNTVTKKSLVNTILNSIRGRGRGFVFSAKDFTPLGDRKSIDISLLRLLEKGEVRRVSRGIYDFPRFSKLMNKEVAVDMDLVARAIARKFGWTIQPSGATAQLFLGLSTQVPGRYVYASDGPNKTLDVGNSKISFTKTPLKESKFKHRESSLIVQAIKDYGRKENIPEDFYEKVRSWHEKHSKVSTDKIIKDTKCVSAWIHETILNTFKEN